MKRIIGASSLLADVIVPKKSYGVVIFAHGSGSSRLSPRNMQVATHLNHAGFATILFDLLSEGEAKDRRNVFDISLLGSRMSEAIAFAQKALPGQSIGLFGASTGAAAALLAAAQFGDGISAVVSRGGRPDLALDVLDRVLAPTLFIVGGDDAAVVEMNQKALAALRCIKCLEIVPGATHLFEEPGTLDRVIELATGWFNQHLVPRRLR